MKVDEIDKEILNLLMENGRISYSTIGEKLNLSRVSVSTRVNNLVEAGVIEHFTCIVNSAKVGKEVSAFFEVDCEPKYLVDVAEKLANNPLVVSCYQMTGPSTLHVHVLVKDFSELEFFINEQLYALDGISHVENNILLRRFKSRRGLKL